MTYGAPYASFSLRAAEQQPGGEMPSEEGENDDWLYGEPPPNTVRIHYIKSPYFRVIHVDGAYGGLTGRGYVHAALYNERKTIPLVSQISISDGPMSNEKIVRGRKHIAREVEADLIFDAKTAREFAKWLNDKADALEKFFPPGGPP